MNLSRRQFVGKVWALPLAAFIPLNGISTPKDSSNSSRLKHERNVLGFMVINPEAWHLLRDHVRESDFSLLKHRRLFVLLREMLENTQPVDAITILMECEKKREEIDFAFLSQIMDEFYGTVDESMAVLLKDRCRHFRSIYKT